MRFGRLTVTETLRIDGREHYRVRCDCGTEKRVYGSNVRLGKTTSCGCVQKARTRAANGKHLAAGTAEYRIWSHIKRRCFDEADPAFKDYGGRGITMCDRWRDDFAAFIADVGARPSADHTIDREDNSRGYEPGNVRWATWKQQQRNRRSNHLVEFNGRTMPVSEAIEASGTSTPWSTIYHRLQRGWPIERALQ